MTGSHRFSRWFRKTHPLPRAKVALYNIRSGAGNNLNQALRSMDQMHIDFGLFTETKLNHDMYTKDCCGYTVFATKAKSTSQGGVAFFYRTESDRWSIEGLRVHGPNVISCTVVSGGRYWSLIGAYIAPSETDGATLRSIAAAVSSCSHPLLFLGDINVDLAQSDLDDRGEDIATALALLGLFDVSMAFQHPKGRWTWSQWREGCLLRSTTDWILAEQLEDIVKWALKCPRGYHSDHRLLLVELSLAPMETHRRYLHSRRQFPAWIPRPFTRVDQAFMDLLEFQRPPDPKGQRDRSWIASDTWRLIDRRAEIRRLHLFSHSCIQHPQVDPEQGKHYEDELRKLHIEIRRHLRRDRRLRADKVSREIESLLVSGDLRGAYHCLTAWYKDRGGRSLRPTRHDLNLTTKEYRALFSAIAPSGDSLPIHVQPAQINDGPPDEDEILVALKHMRRGKVPGPSGMRVEDLLRWHHEVPKAWSLVLSIVDSAFSEGRVPYAFWLGILVLIPKDEPAKFRGIALLEVLYKLCATIIHLRLSDGIVFHPGIHGFCSNRGTPTAGLEAKLLMQFCMQQSIPLFQVFLDLTKAYDTLDRTRTMAILQAYGVGPSTRRLIGIIWDGDTLIPKSGGFYGTPFHAERGVRQGDVLSPMIFNIVIDCVLREWYYRMGESTDLISIFYADDGRLAGFTVVSVQQGVDTFIDLFARVGLFLNPTKTKAMFSMGAPLRGMMSPIAYKRRYDGVLPSYRERKLAKVSCPHCDKSISAQYLPTHIRTIHNLSVPLASSSVPFDPDEHFYSISIPERLPVSCPVPGCPATPVGRQGMRNHFHSRHVYATLSIQEDGPTVRCPNCRKFLQKVTPRHLNSRLCQVQTARRQARERLQAQLDLQDTAKFYIGNRLIDLVSFFKYLGRWLADDDSDTLAVTKNLQKARLRWGRISRLLSRQTASPTTMARFYLAVIQSVLLYGCETWVLSQRDLHRLERFHARCARHLAHRHIRPRPDGSWETPPTSEVLDDCNLSPIATYIAKRKTSLLPYAKYCSALYQRCLHSQPVPNGVHRLVWWTPS